MKLAHVILATAVLVLTGCASSGGPRKVTYEEASAFEHSLMARTKKPTRDELIYTQPVNKSEPCRLPSSQEQLDRPKFRAYWDGDCKNGFAYGLGRDIAISDTHHVEEITIHDGTGGNWSQPRVLYDFVNNIVSYSVGGAKEPENTTIWEKYINSASGFSASQSIAVVDESGNSSVLNTSPFHTKRFYASSNIDGSFVFRFSDDTSAPVIDPNTATFSFNVIDPKTNTRGGFSIIGYGNGQLRHFRMVNGEFGEVVMLPFEYTSHINSVYQKVRRSVAGAIPVLESPQRIEREYLFKVCNGKGSIAGLDKAAYSKICTWRDQFKEPYAAASAKFQQQLESMKAQAVTAEQQRQLQQQIAVQQQMLKKQQDQQAWNEMMSEISRASEQVRNSTERSMSNTNNWQAPQLQPLSIAPRRNTAICQTIGSIVTCN